MESRDPHDHRDRLMRLVREEVVRLRSLGEDGDNLRQHRRAIDGMLHDGLGSAVPSLPRIGETEPPIEIRSEYRVDTFLAYHDEDFIRNAYRGILHREPDVGGLTSFLSRLRSATMSKVEILGRLRYSPEGRAAAVVVHGLLLPLALRTARQVPVVGWLMGVVQYFLRLPNLVRNHERLEAAMFHRQLESRRQFNASQEKTEQELARMITAIRTLDAKHNVAKRQVNDAGADIGPELSALQDLLRTTVEGLDAKHAQTEMILASLQHSVAQRGEVDRRVLTIERALELKADNERLTQLANYTTELVQSKAEQTRLDALAQEIDARVRDLQALTQALANSKADHADIQAVALEVRDRVRATMTEIDGLKTGKADRAHVDSLVHGATTHLDYVKNAVAALEADAPGTTNAIGELRISLNEHRLALLAQQRTIATFLDDARKRLPGPMTTADLQDLVLEENHLLDAFYVSFEDRFRGTPEDIKQRVTVYLPMIREANAGTAEAAVLDIGCGRGEWLELLKESELVARGVDLNRVVVRQCRERGLEVIEGEAVEYLRGLKSNSLGAITGMHLIEHIGFKQLIALFDEALRVLRPGGLLIVETPNPENLIVGACNFYYDPTHQHPLPPEPTRFVAEARGFAQTEILRLHPFPVSANIVDGPTLMKERLNSLFYGPQDYAIIARKPS